MFIIIVCLPLSAKQRRRQWQKRRWKTENGMSESWLVPSCRQNVEYCFLLTIRIHRVAYTKKKQYKIYTYIHTKVLENHFIFHFTIRSFWLFAVLNKFYSELLLEIIYVCWTYVAHHSISPANYLHKRELRFLTIRRTHRGYKLYTTQNSYCIYVKLIYHNVVSWLVAWQKNETGRT